MGTDVHRQHRQAHEVDEVCTAVSEGEADPRMDKLKEIFYDYRASDVSQCCELSRAAQTPPINNS